MDKNLIVLLMGLLLFATISGCVSTESPNQLPIEQLLQEEAKLEINETEQEIDEAEQMIISHIEQMSLQEKLGQMIIAGITGTTLTSEEQSLIRDYHVGGLIFYGPNLTNPTQTLSLLNQLKAENAHNLLPLFLGIDQEGGRVSRLPEEIYKLPENKVLGDINDPQLSFAVGASLGRQLRAFGFNLNFAPVLDVNSNPHNPVIGVRSFGNDPELVSRLGRETMKGIKSEQIISVIKHFPGHGDTSVDSHLELPVVNKTRQELDQMELLPFRDAIQDEAEVVMIAHMLLPELDPHSPATLSKAIITEVLRNELGFQGVVLTDDLTMKAITNHYNIGFASVESIKAGSDILLIAHEYNNAVTTFKALQEAVFTGEITEDRINESVYRIIRLKWNYALTNEPVDHIDLENLNKSISDVLKRME